MRKKFEENGIGVIHDKTVHDYPSYNSAYQSAAATIQKNLNENKNIKVVLDVHRDGITREDGTKVKLVTDINGEKTAQIMIVVGTDTNLPHDKWQENFKFASKIQAKGVELYPSLMRPIDLRKERFNEQLTTGSIIIEVGSNGNTMGEAIRGGERVAEIISAVLKEG
jgi:stage II sporulation protein P